MVRSPAPGSAAKQTCWHAVDQPVVDLIRDDDQVVLLGDAQHLQQRLARGHRAGRVVGIADQDGLGARRDGGFQRFRVDLEIVLHAAGDLHRHAARQDHLRLVGDEARGGDDHFVARVQDGGQRQVQRFRDAHGDDDLVDRVVAHAVQPLQVRGQRLAQLQHARSWRCSASRRAAASGCRPPGSARAW